MLTNETKPNMRHMLISNFGAKISNKTEAHIQNTYINLSNGNPAALRHTNHVEPADQSRSIST